MNDVKTGEIILGGLNLDFEKAEQGVQNPVVPVTVNEVQEFTNKYKTKLREDSQVQGLVSRINVTDTRSILEFGHEASEAITSISDRLLSSIRSVDQEEAGEILLQLTKVMKRFEVEDFKKMKEPGFFEKFFKKVKNSVESILAKYDTMGAEVDRIYMILKKYEADVMNDSQKLSELYKANIQYYQELEKYIVAGELALEELDNKYLPQYEQLALNGESIDQQNYQTLKFAEICLTNEFMT